MFKGNRERVNADAALIVRRLRTGKVTLEALLEEYRCAYPTMKRAILSRITQRQYDRIMAKHHFPNAGCFAKGLVPWNKGRKGWCPKACEKTWFKKGQIRGKAARQWRKRGSVTIRRGKPLSNHAKPRYGPPTRWIKVRDDGPLHQRYIPLARYLWELAHGRKVPKGFFVVHKDHNTMNDSLENLILVDRAEHMRRLYARPGVIAKCRRKAAQAATKRHAENRAAKKAFKLLRQRARAVWECPDCSAEYHRPLAQCLHCGVPLRRIVRKPMPESMRLEAMIREVREAL